MLNETILAKRDLILEIAKKHGVKSVRVFGSFARDDAKPDSDLDLLIEAGEKTSPWFPGGLVYELEEKLGRRVDVVEKDGLREAIRDRVIEESVPL